MQKALKQSTSKKGIAGLLKEIPAPRTTIEICRVTYTKKVCFALKRS